MASRKELEVGQVRELLHPSPGRYANTNVAKCRILALDQRAELYRRGDGSYASSGYRMHEDMVLVEVLGENGWTWDYNSTLQTREALGSQVKGFVRTGSRHYNPVPLPDYQYLVKPKLLGPVWNEEEKQALAKAEAIASKRREAYDAAARHRDQQLSEELSDAGISSRSRRGGHQWQLSSNDLATLINYLLQNEAIPLVHWKDYQDMEVEV